MKVSTFVYPADERKDIPIPPDWEAGDRSLAVVFGAPGYAHQSSFLTDLTRKLGVSRCVGCSTAGEIFGSRVLDGSLVVALVQFEHTRIQVASVPIAQTSDSLKAGADLARRLASHDLAGVFVLTDGLIVNGSQLIAGMNAELPESVVITGGLAGDGPRFERTWVLHEGRPESGRVTGVGFYGSRVRLGHGSRGGWDLFGIERRITRSEGNILYELDGQPALQLYKEYLGPRALELPASALLFPLSIRADAGADKSVVRTILSVDETRQSMTFAGDLPQGWLAQLMRANFDRLVQGAADAAARTGRSPLSEGPALSIAISCVGRRLVLGSRADEETEATSEALGPATQQIGFYSYGELSPFASGRCDLHNQTMTLTVIGED